MADSDSDVERVYVTAGPKLTEGQLAAYEVDPAHPLDEMSGENRIFITADGETYEAGLTSLVADKIRLGELVQTKDTKGSKSAKTEEAAPASSTMASTSSKGSSGNNG